MTREEFSARISKPELPPKEVRILSDFTEEAIEDFQENLLGVYLHGSAAMGCYNPGKSDLDLLVVLKEMPGNKEKRAFMDRVLRLSSELSEKGIEMSVLLERDCRPFVYPTPFVLHFSEMHRARYLADPERYLREMQGTDPDLAAHLMILTLRGQCLFGKEIREVFERPDARSYLAGIEEDIGDASEGILRDPVYYTLNLLRVLAFKRENLVLSKKEAALWASEYQDAEVFGELIKASEAAYTASEALKELPPVLRDREKLTAFSEAMIGLIRETKLRSLRCWTYTEEGVSACFEDHVVRVRADRALQRVLKSGRAAGKAFTERLRIGYRERMGTELLISNTSLYAEIRLHAFSDRVFQGLSDLFGKLRLSPLEKLCRRLQEHSFQIDCGEKSVDGNRRIFDLLSVFYGK